MFGSELSISPAQVLAAEAEKKRREQEAEQFAAKMQDLAQARVAERERSLSSGMWEKQKWGAEQEWKERAAAQTGEAAAFEQRKYGEAPGREMAIEQFKAGLEPKDEFIPTDQFGNPIDTTTTQVTPSGGIWQKNLRTGKMEKGAEEKEPGKISIEKIDTGDKIIMQRYDEQGNIVGEISIPKTKKQGETELKIQQAEQIWGADWIETPEALKYVGAYVEEKETPEERRKAEEELANERVRAQREAAQREAGIAGIPLETVTGGGRTYKKEKPTKKMPTVKAEGLTAAQTNKLSEATKWLGGQPIETKKDGWGWWDSSKKLQPPKTRKIAEDNMLKYFGLLPSHPEVKAVIDYFFPEATSQGGRVEVINPAGRVGYIPRSQLKEALKQGYKQK